MGNELPRGVFRIDGNLYTARCLKAGAKEGAPNEWDQLLDDVGEDDTLLHWKDIYFWRQEASEELYSYAIRGFSSSRRWDKRSCLRRTKYIGFRPVLVPLEEATLKQDTKRFAGQTGIRTMGCLLLNGRETAVEPDPDRIPRYELHQTISFGDTRPGLRPLEWIAWNGVLVSTCVVLRSVGWRELDENWLVKGYRGEISYGSGSMPATFYMPNGEIILGRWEPLHIRKGDLSSSIVLPDGLELFDYIGSSQRVSKEWLWTSASLLPSNFIYKPNEEKEIPAQLQSLSEEHLVCDNRAVYTAYKNEPCYIVSNSGKISLGQYEGQKVGVFRLDELGRALTVALNLAQDNAMREWLRGDAKKELEVHSYAPKAPRVPCYPNRDEEYAVTLASNCLARMFQGVENLEGLPGYEETLMELVRAIYRDKELYAHAFIDGEERAMKLAAEFFFGLAAELD